MATMTYLDAIGIRLVQAGLEVRTKGTGILVTALEGVKPVGTTMTKPRKPRRVGEKWTDAQGTTKKKTTQHTLTWSKTERRWIKPDPNKQRQQERKRKGGFGIS